MSERKRISRSSGNGTGVAFSPSGDPRLTNALKRARGEPIETERDKLNNNSREFVRGDIKNRPLTREERQIIKSNSMSAEAWRSLEKEQRNSMLLSHYNKYENSNLNLIPMKEGTNNAPSAFTGNGLQAPNQYSTQGDDRLQDTEQDEWQKTDQRFDTEIPAETKDGFHGEDGENAPSRHHSSLNETTEQRVARLQAELQSAKECLEYEQKSSTLVSRIKSMNLSDTEVREIHAHLDEISSNYQEQENHSDFLYSNNNGDKVVGVLHSDLEESYEIRVSQEDIDAYIDMMEF